MKAKSPGNGALRAKLLVQIAEEINDVLPMLLFELQHLARIEELEKRLAKE